MDTIYFVARTPALPVVLYLLTLAATWRCNRILFDAFSTLGFIGLLMAFLASRGETAMVIALIACIHLSLSFASGRLRIRSGRSHAAVDHR